MPSLGQVLSLSLSVCPCLCSVCACQCTHTRTHQCSKFKKFCNCASCHSLESLLSRGASKASSCCPGPFPLLWRYAAKHTHIHASPLNLLCDALLSPLTSSLARAANHVSLSFLHLYLDPWTPFAPPSLPSSCFCVCL
jgi:hypothetical protein